VYNDPLGYRGSYEGIVQIKDFDMSKKMERFLKRSGLKIIPLMEQIKKKNVVGVSMTVIVAAGDLHHQVHLLSKPTKCRLICAKWSLNQL
jgi:dipeptidyl-peptidase-3